MLVSPTEPQQLKTAGRVSAMPERKGADILVVGRGVIIGIQRKQFPGDFYASMRDGRLHEQTHRLLACDMRIVVFEGHPTWTRDGRLVDHPKISRQQMWGLTWTLWWEYQCMVQWTRNVEETVDLCQRLEKWARKKTHRSLRTRPGPKTGGWWFDNNPKVWGIHMLQGIAPGVGPGKAEAIYDHFGRVPLRWDLPDGQRLSDVTGVGEVLERRFVEAFQPEQKEEGPENV